MKRIIHAVMILLMSCVMAYATEYDLGGLWNIYGTGFAEKSFVRISMELFGRMTLTTCRISDLSADVVNVISDDTITLISRDKVDENLRALTGYEIDLRIEALANTGININAWEDHLPDGIRIPVVFPAREPSAEFPFVLPAVSADGMRYQVVFTSLKSGKVRINGYVDFDIVGSTEINSDCALWKEGTEMPALESETKSGCNSGAGFLAVMAMIIAGVRKFVRH